jgi:hypothetical protein
MFSGTLIEALIATVERAEQVAPSNETLVVDSAVRDAWLVSVQGNAGCNFEHLYWHESGVA